MGHTQCVPFMRSAGKEASLLTGKHSCYACLDAVHHCSVYSCLLATATIVSDNSYSANGAGTVAVHVNVQQLKYIAK